MNYFQAAVCLENKAPQLQGGWRPRENSRWQAGFLARLSGAREAWALPALPLQGGEVGGQVPRQPGDHTRGSVCLTGVLRVPQ